MIEDVDHLGIVVADLEEADRFVCEVLGFATDCSRNLWNSKRPIRTLFPPVITRG